MSEKYRTHFTCSTLQLQFYLENDEGIKFWTHVDSNVNKWHHYFIVESATNSDLKIKGYLVDWGKIKAINFQGFNKWDWALKIISSLALKVDD